MLRAHIPRSVQLLPHGGVEQGTPIQRLAAENSAIQLRKFWLAILGLIFCFAVPLWHLIRFAADSRLYSYILLVPIVSLYLVWLRGGSYPPCSQPDRKIAAGFSVAGCSLLAHYWLHLRPNLKMPEEDYLVLMLVSFLLFISAAAAIWLGKKRLRTALFPLGFLFFMVPLPVVVIESIDEFLQQGSAVAAGGFFALAGTPFLQDGLAFQLPGVTLQIAPECSGIHSSLVLLLTSLLAGNILLRTPWKRAVLVLAVIPLGLIRNGFRVFIIGELCVRHGPQMIDSAIHRHGGPVFFILSLLALFALLFLLQRTEKPPTHQNVSSNL